MSMSSSGPRPSDRFIPWYFVLAFLVIFAVNATMVTLAVRSSPGLVTDHHYERGLGYNEYLASASAQVQLGWQSHLQYAQGKLRVELLDKQGASLRGAQLEVQLMRPVHAGQDFAVTLAQTAAGSYEGQADFPQPGLWTATVVATWNGHKYRQQQDLIIRP